MSYPPNTILGRIDPLPDVDGEANPLNKLRVVAEASTNRSSVEEWQGAGGIDFVIVTPVDVFGSNETAPVSALNAEYEVLEYGDEADNEKRIELESPAHKRQQKLSPEQVFAAEANEARKADQKKGGRPLVGAALAAQQKKAAAEAGS